MANESNPGDAGLRPRWRAGRPPPEGARSQDHPPRRSRGARVERERTRQFAVGGEDGGPSGGGHPALHRGPKPAHCDGFSVGVAPLARHHRTRLPHIEAGDVPQHACFRLADSVPPNIRRALTDSLRRGAEAKVQVAWRKRVETTLDAGYGACWLQRPDIAALVRDALLHFDRERYQLHEWVVMPNHTHVLLTPLEAIPLSSILHSWKAYTAKQANAMLGRSGAFWDSDYFDRAIRNERHFSVTAQYIRANPVNAGLCAAPEDWRWSSAAPSVRDARPSWLLSGASSAPKPSARRNPRQRTMRSLHAS